MPVPPSRRRGGRPTLTPPERRTAAVLVRFTAAERAAVQARAKRAGRIPARFIREAALGTPIRVPREVVNAEAVRELARVGSNLNQLAREANAGRFPEAAARLEAALGELHAAIMRL